MKVALAFLSKDRVELTKRSIEPLLQPDKFDLFVIDGSKTEQGRSYAFTHTNANAFTNIGGGADAAIVFALSTMLQAGFKYDYVGLIENDVLLNPDWFGPTMALFERGKADGLEVGAVSARSYEDRILIQRDGYAVMHNLGAGMVIFTRQAAELILANYRNGFSTENRACFSQLTDIDIGRYWAFRGSEHFLTADWHFDVILARNGLSSLALTPGLATMLDQDIAPLGLKYADGKIELLRSDPAMEKLEARSSLIRSGEFKLGVPGAIFSDSQGQMIFPHQLPMIGGLTYGAWELAWSQGFGPFAWRAGEQYVDRGPEGFTVHDLIPQLSATVFGPCELYVSGGKMGGTVKVTDSNGYSIVTELAPEGEQRQVSQISVPGGCNSRTVSLLAKSSGTTFYGIRTRFPQPVLTDFKFDHSCLPPVAV